MARALDSEQAARNARSRISPVTLAKLTTYTDHGAETVDEIFYLSTHPVLYDWENAGTDRTFKPVIIGGSNFVSSIGDHIPDPSTLLVQFFDLNVTNASIDGQRFAMTLLGFTLEGADIDIAQLLLTAEEMNSMKELGFIDLSGYAGDEHTMLFRGRVDQFAPITAESATLVCSTRLPTMADEWIYATDETASNPRDIGKRLPRVYGEAKHVPIIGWIVGFSGTLAEDIDSSEDNVEKWVTSTSGLPSNPTEFTIQIGREKIKCVKSTINPAVAIKIVTGGRGQSLTTPAAHSSGDTFEEILSTPVWILSDQESDQIPIVYEVNENTGRLVRIEESIFGIIKTLADTTTISGRTITSMSVGSTEDFIQGARDIEQIENINHKNRAVDFWVSSTDETRGVLDAGAPGTVVFEDPPGVVYSEFTFRCWLTRHNEGQNEDVDIKIDGTTVVDTIAIASIPSAGSTPQMFEFVLDPIPSSPVNEVRIDPQGTGDVRIHHVERTINVQVQIEMQEADTVTAEANVVDKDNVKDGSDTTFASFTNDNNQFITCAFPTPSFGNPNISRVYFIARSNGQSRTFQIQSSGGSPMSELGHTDAGAKHAYRWDIESAINSIRFNTTEGADWGDIYRFYREAVLIASPPATSPTQQLFADIDGVVSPSTAYDAAVGDTLTKPADIIKHWIEEVGGEVLEDASHTSLLANLPSLSRWAFDVRSMGFTWIEILQRMAFEARCNIIPIETSTGREWRILSADQTYGWGTPTKTITQTQDLTHEGLHLSAIASSFSFMYAFDAANNAQGSETDFNLALVANPSVSDVPISTTDIDNAAKRFGNREAGPIAFRAIQDTNTAKDVAGYIVQERMANARRLYRLEGVAWFDALQHEVGDLVKISTPWEAGIRFFRIITMEKEFEANVWTLVVVEILVVGLHT